MLEESFKKRAKNGVLDVHLAGVLARELGASPSQADLLEFEATCGKSVNFDNFKDFLAVSMYSSENREYLQDLLTSFENVAPYSNLFIYLIVFNLCNHDKKFSDVWRYDFE